MERMLGCGLDRLDREGCGVLKGKVELVRLGVGVHLGDWLRTVGAAGLIPRQHAIADLEFADGLQSLGGRNKRLPGEATCAPQRRDELRAFLDVLDVDAGGYIQENAATRKDFVERGSIRIGNGLSVFDHALELWNRDRRP